VWRWLLKVLVTGADGFTGRHFCRHANRVGYEVVELKSNLLDTHSLKDEIFSAQPDFVVHLAAVSFVGSPDQSSFYAVNVIGTTNLLDVIAELSKTPKKVLLASSANIYGNCNISSIDETVTPNPINHYAMSKFSMEKMSLTYANKIDLVITRPFNYTGPGQDVKFVIPKLVECFSTKRPTVSLGNLNVEREFNDVNLVCESYLNLLTYGVSGETYNVCSGVAYSLKFIIGKLSSMTGHSIKVEIDPRFVRSNEVALLKGDPAKLENLLRNSSVKLYKSNLESTLSIMLNDGLNK
jgi:nucleoside-diphosphate-sugar epimerase